MGTSPSTRSIREIHVPLPAPAPGSHGRKHALDPIAHTFQPVHRQVLGMVRKGLKCRHHTLVTVGGCEELAVELTRGSRHDPPHVGQHTIMEPVSISSASRTEPDASLSLRASARRPLPVPRLAAPAEVRPHHSPRHERVALSRELQKLQSTEIGWHDGLESLDSPDPPTIAHSPRRQPGLALMAILGTSANEHRVVSWQCPRVRCIADRDAGLRVISPSTLPSPANFHDKRARARLGLQGRRVSPCRCRLGPGSHLSRQAVVRTKEQGADKVVVQAVCSWWTWEPAQTNQRYERITGRCPARGEYGLQHAGLPTAIGTHNQVQPLEAVELRPSTPRKSG